MGGRISGMYDKHMFNVGANDAGHILYSSMRYFNNETVPSRSELSHEGPSPRDR